MNFRTMAIIVAACVSCVEWTRIIGRVKGINLKSSTVVIQNRDGDLLTVPIDYQVTIIEKSDERRGLKDLVLDEKVTLINTPSEKFKDETFEEMNKQK